MSTNGKHDRDKSSSETSSSDPSFADVNNTSPEPAPSTPSMDQREELKASDNIDGKDKSDKKRRDGVADASDAQDENDEGEDDEEDDESEDDEEDDESEDDEEDDEGEDDEEDDEGEDDEEDDEGEDEDDKQDGRSKAGAASSHAPVRARGASDKGSLTGKSKGAVNRGLRSGTKSKVVRKNLDDVPLPSRKSEMVAGGVLAAGAYVALWIGYSIYAASVTARHSSYFSNSAWAFAVGLFLLLLAVMTWIRYDRRHLEALTTTGAGIQPKSKAVRPPSHTAKSEASSASRTSTETTAKKNFDSPHKAKYELSGLVWATLVGGPVYAVYWWKAAEVWQRMFATERPSMWAVFVILFAITSVAVAYGLMPPSLNEEWQRVMPVRRVVLLVMSPFAFVFGMLYLGAFYPPWP